MDTKDSIITKDKVDKEGLYRQRCKCCGKWFDGKVKNEDCCPECEGTIL